MVKNVKGNCAVGNNGSDTYSKKAEIVCMELENDYKVWKEVEDFWRKNVNSKDKEELIDTLAIKVKNIYSIGKDSIKIEEKLNLKEVTSVETEKGLLRCITLTTEIDENEMDKLAMKHSLELNKYFKSIDNKMNIQNVYATQIKNKITTYIWYYI